MTNNTLITIIGISLPIILTWFFNRRKNTQDLRNMSIAGEIQIGEFSLKYAKQMQDDMVALSKKVDDLSAKYEKVKEDYEKIKEEKLVLEETNKRQAKQISDLQGEVFELKKAQGLPHP